MLTEAANPPNHKKAKRPKNWRAKKKDGQGIEEEE